MPPSTNSDVSDAFKAKITSLIQQQLKPIVTELAAQQQSLLNNLALLKHNHNVNDYQMTRLESIRDLEQSINFKVSGALGFDPWEHPTMGTNLREPVPADPELIPKFTPVNQVTPAERATQSVALIKEAGLSACKIGVPLTFQDFPDHPSMNSRTKKEDPMHASIPLFGLRAPRWRAKQGLDDHPIPGTAAYDGVVVRPAGRGLKLYSKHAKQLKVPMWKLIEQGDGPLGIGAASSSSSPGAGPSNSQGVQGGGSAGMSAPAPSEAGASSTQNHDTLPPEEAQRASSSNTGKEPLNTSSSTDPSARPKPLRRTYAVADLEAPPRPKPLRRTYAIADMEASIPTSTSASNRAPKPATLRRTETMTTIGSTTSITSETSTHSSFSRLSTTATVGSEPRSSSSRKAKVTTAKTKTKTKTKQSTSKQRSTRTKTAAAPTSSTSTITEQPKHTPILKRGRRTAELEDTDDDSFQDREEAEPAHKRRKASVVASDTGSESTTRRSARVTRASTAAAATNAAVPAPRGRPTKGKKGNKRS